MGIFARGELKMRLKETTKGKFFYVDLAPLLKRFWAWLDKKIARR